MLPQLPCMSPAENKTTGRGEVFTATNYVTGHLRSLGLRSHRMIHRCPSAEIDPLKYTIPKIGLREESD